MIKPSDCIAIITHIEKTPYSFLQKVITEGYDNCLHKVVQTNVYYDLNGYFGTIVILTLVICILGIGIYLDKKRS